MSRQYTNWLMKRYSDGSIEGTTERWVLAIGGSVDWFKYDVVVRARTEKEAIRKARQKLEGVKNG